MVRMYRELPDVRDPVYQLDTHESRGWVADDQDQQRLAEVVLSVVVRERSDPYGCKQSVRLELDPAQPRVLLRTRSADDRS